MSFLSILFEQGGYATYLIIIAGLTLLVIGSERLAVLFFVLSHNTHSSLESIRSLILEKKYTDAIQVCNANPNAPDIAIVKAGLMAVENAREAMRSAIGGAVLSVGHRCDIRVGYLALIANVATLLGLLGTISGLIKTFASIANADTAEKAKMLGMGISEAMYATATGLCVGIAAMVVHTICTSRADSIIGNAQDTGLKLITWVEQSERA